MKILDRYVAREMAVPFVAGFFVILILLLGNIVYNNINIIVSRISEWRLLLYFILLKSPNFVMLSLPSGALFGCSLAITRLVKDNEITVMRAAGISLRRIFLPAFVVGALLSGCAYLFQEKVTVWAERESVQVIKRLWMASGPPPVEANVFFKIDQYTFYINEASRDGNKLILRGVMIWEPPSGQGFATLTTADTAQQVGSVWVLKHGRTVRINAAGDPELVATFETANLNIHQNIADYFLAEQKSPKGMSIGELRQQMDQLKKTGQKDDQFQLEFGYKLAIPLSSLVLMFCIAPLSVRFGKGGGFTGVLVSICVLFLYWNVILFSQVLGNTGGLPPWLAGWSEVIIFTVVGAVLVWKME